MNRTLVIALLVLSGCGGHSIHNMDKPAPEAYEKWMKPGLSQIDIKKAMLECGAPHYAVTGFMYEKALGLKTLDEQLSHAFMVSACMEKSGFVARWDSVEQSCRKFPKYQFYPACQPGAVIPERSVERRLNSWHCKLKTDREYCRKHAFTASACDDPKKDYDNPPPECRP